MANFRIVAPHFVAGCSNGKCAPIIRYMENWSIERISTYCLSKGWLLEIISREHLTGNSSLTNRTETTKGDKMSGFGNQDYSNIFKGIASAKSMTGGGFAERLGLGTHRVALKSFKVKESTKGQGQFLEAEFVVVSSNAHKAGESRGWVWFINSTGWSGAYEQDRAKKFLEAVGASIGDESPVDSIGANLAGPNQAGMGLLLDVSVVPQTGKNAGKLNAKGEPYSNIYWKAVPQTLEDLASQRAELESLEPVAPPVQAQTPSPQTSAPRAGLGLLGRK